MSDSKAMRQPVARAVAQAAMGDSGNWRSWVDVADAAIAAVHAEQERQATDREAKAENIDIPVIPFPGARSQAHHWRQAANTLEKAHRIHSSNMTRAAASLMRNAADFLERQRLNVNPNLGTEPNPLCWCGKDNETHHAEEADHKFEPSRDGETTDDL